MRRYLASEELTAQPAEALCQFGFLVIRLTRFLEDELYLFSSILNALCYHCMLYLRGSEEAMVV